MGRPQDSDARAPEENDKAEAALNSADCGTSEKAGEDTKRPENIEEPTEKEPRSGRESVRTLWRSHRPKVLAAAAAFVAAVAAATALTVGLPEQQQPGTPAHTVAVTYKVTGEGPATITYNGGRPGEPRERKQSVELPWSKQLRIAPAGGKARVSLVLGEDGGRAQCTVAVDGRHRQRATAFGSYGRASCTAEVAARKS